MAYNPYNAIKGIYDSKVAYHTNQSLGKDPKQYHQQALPYYTDLVNNGYEGLATQLEGMDAVQAAELLKNYKPDEQFAVDEAYSAMTGNAKAQAPNEQHSASYTNMTDKANSIINAPHQNDSSIDKLMGMGTGESGMAQDVFNTAQGIATGAIQTQPSASTQGLLNAYNDSNNRLNGAIQYDQNGNVISGLNTEHYNIGRNQLDYLNNFDVTKQPYYQGIMDAYKLGGYNAAQGEYANGAANNGGNIDSYAAANANRQQLAYTTAGMQQAMALANQNQQNWQNLYSQMSSDLNNQGQLSLQTLDIAKQMYATDAQERMNALDVNGSLASQQMAAAVQAFQALVQERMNDKGITAEMALKEADIAAARDQLEMQLASNERIQEGINALGYYQTDANERMNTENNATQRYGYDTNLAGIRDTNAANTNIAGINANAQLGVAGINRDATLGAAGINANASLAQAQLNADLNRYLGELGYQQAIEGYKNNYSIAELNNMSAQELQRLVNEGNLATATVNANAKINSETGNNSVTDDEPISPEVAATVMANAILTSNLEDINLSGLNNVHSADDLNRLLMDSNTGYGFTTKEVNDFYKNLGYVGMDTDGFLARLSEMIPGIDKEIKKRTSYLTTAETN